MYLFYFIFIHLLLLVPAYGAIRRFKIASDRPTLQLCIAYFSSITLLGLSGFGLYGLDIPEVAIRAILILLTIGGVTLFIQQKAWIALRSHLFLLALFFIMSLIPTLVISLSATSTTPKYFPDPEYNSKNNYSVLSVKVLNFAHTPANDNYIPYRQAQFFVNNSDPQKDSFINEWGVTFFQRTVMMGSVVSSIFTLMSDDPPIPYLWAHGVSDPDDTYVKFQITAHILNSVLIIPAFILINMLFNRKTALLSSIFIASSHFYLYNSIFSWPKSLTAFFALLSLVLLLEKRRGSVLLSALVMGVAYLTHDLAIVFLATNLMYLLLTGRIKDLFIYLLAALPVPAVWAYISSVIYSKPSTFFYYPFTLEGLPQESNKRAIISTFFRTSPLEILRIKLSGLEYLATPYQIVHSEGGKPLSNRIWALGIYSVPGSLGLGLMALGAYSVLQGFKKIKWEIWYFMLFPLLVILFLFGNPRVLGSLHFSEPILVLMIATVVYLTLKLKKLSSQLLIMSFVINVIYTLFFIAYSFDFKISQWFTNPSDMLVIIILLVFYSFMAYLIKITAFGDKNSHLSRLKI